jgi:glycosyltransferase involved in cell wall biosynthesis
MDNMIKLSVIIPMYNVEQYLAKCINSVYNQGLNEDEFEVILIDDESPDNSLVIATILTKDKKNVKIISQKNKGLGGARNSGLDYAKGEYVLFLDSDDFYLPNTLKKIIEIIEKNELDILEFGAQGLDQNYKTIFKLSVSSNEKLYNGINYYQNIRYSDTVCNKLYYRNFINKNNLRFLEKIYIEDYEFNTRAFSVAENVMATPLIVSQFLQSPNSITRNNSIEKKEKMKIDIFNVMKNISELKQKESKHKSVFFEERLSFLTATLFYQLVKNKASYKDFVKLKSRLIEEGLFYVNFPIFDKRKNLFRIVFLKNFFLLRFITK